MNDTFTEDIEEYVVTAIDPMKRGLKAFPWIVMVPWVKCYSD